MSTGLAPVRAPAREWDDAGLRLNVFVAGVIAAGALMSLFVGLTESIGTTRGRERLARRATPVAEMMVAGVVSGYGATARSSVGLRPRRHYLAIAVVLVGIAALPVAAGSDDFLSDDRGAVIVSALALSAALILITMASVFAAAVTRYPNVPSVVRRLAPARPRATTSIWAAVPRPARRLLYTFLAGFVGIALLVVLAEDVLLRVDEPLYFDLLESSGDVDRWTPGWVNYLGRWEIATPIAILLGLIVLRNRFVAIAYPAVIVIAGVANTLIGWATHRLRPPLGGHEGEFTSFPGGHSIQLTLLLGMLPLAAFILTRRRWVGAVVAVFAALVWAAAWADLLRTGGHWPSDHLAGMLLGAALLAVVYGVAADRAAKRVRGSPVR